MTDQPFDPGSSDPYVDVAPWPDVDGLGEPIGGFDPGWEQAPYNGATTADLGVVTDPRSAYEATFWQQQTENGFCAPTSIAIVLSELYGQNLDAQTFVDRAVELGILQGSPGAWEGMTLDEAQRLMESFGVGASIVYPNSAGEAWDQLATLTTDANYGVVAYIDSSEVWESTDDDSSSLQLDHAVVVTHVDDDFVYLNDPGVPDGQQLQVPRDDFMDAWDDSGHGMLVTDQPTVAPQDGSSDHYAGTGGPTDPAAGQLDHAGYAAFLEQGLGSRALALLPVVLASSSVEVVAATRITGPSAQP